MADMIETVRTVAELRARVDAWRAAGETVAMVPTMGALHAGHLSLIEKARTQAARTVVTLFVNPLQFGPNEDLDVYPRDEAGDAAKLADAGGDLLYAPSVETMYPSGSATKVTVPGLGDILEGACRPGFFTGVATVVTKLLLQGRPDVAVFGQKDYQQLLVIKRLVRDLDIPVRIESGETVREEDGLALSSRNAYLSPAERAVAPALHNALSALAEAVRGGASIAEAEREARKAILAAGFEKVDYITARDAETLEAPGPDDADPKRVLAAAWLGSTRLIDNLPA